MPRTLADHGITPPAQLARARPPRTAQETRYSAGWVKGAGEALAWL